MADETTEGGGELVHHESFLDLLMRQQTRGEQGVRLSFHQELLSAVAFNSSPYHYCAVTGDTDLAVYLYSKGIEMSSNNITVASFSAAGTGGNTPWKKVISITAHEAALLAGNHRVARALKLIEKNVPLNWSRGNHSELPQDFKNKVATWMKGLVASNWFLQLPGPARIAVVDKVMNHFFHTSVWSCVAKKTWSQPWKKTLGDDLYLSANTLPEKLLEAPKPAPGPPFPQYQFRVAQDQAGGRRRRFGRFAGPLGRAAFGAVWWAFHRKLGGAVPLGSTLVTFVASGFHPLLEKAPLILAALGNLPGSC